MTQFTEKTLHYSIELKFNAISPDGKVVLHVTDDELWDINGFLHILQINSQNAYVYGSLGADTIIGDTGFRLSELSRFHQIMDKLIQTTSALEDNHQ